MSSERSMYAKASQEDAESQRCVKGTAIDAGLATVMTFRGARSSAYCPIAGDLPPVLPDWGRGVRRPLLAKAAGGCAGSARTSTVRSGARAWRSWHTREISPGASALPASPWRTTLRTARPAQATATPRGETASAPPNQAAPWNTSGAAGSDTGPSG